MQLFRKCSASFLSLLNHCRLIHFLKSRTGMCQLISGGCETWALLADWRKRIQAFETKCMRKLLNISFLEHKTNDWVWSKINFLVGPQEPLLATVKKWKLAWIGHVTYHDSLSKIILQGTLECGQWHGQQTKYWMDYIKEWPSLPMPELLTRVSYKKDWKRICAESSLMSPWWPYRSRDWTELNWVDFYF